MIHLYVDKDLCPCDSGKLLGQCCIGPNNRFRTTPVNTCPPAPMTGFGNPRCFASELTNCSPQLSREHFISHGILKVLSRNGTVSIDGFNWQEGGSLQDLPTPSLASRILCKRHNEALSGLDAMALRLFQTIDNAVRQKQRQSRVFLFDGSDLERWLLKTLCGSVFSRNAHTRGVNSDWRPSALWLNVLFNGVDFPNRCGFYFAGDSADAIEGGFKLRTISNANDGVYGVGISFDDEPFLCLMDTPPDNLAGTYLERYLYRPETIVFLNEYCESVLRFVWNDQLQHGMRVVKYGRS